MYCHPEFGCDCKERIEILETALRRIENQLRFYGLGTSNLADICKAALEPDTLEVIKEV